MLAHSRLGVAEDIDRLFECAAHFQDVSGERMPETMRARALDSGLLVYHLQCAPRITDNRGAASRAHSRRNMCRPDHQRPAATAEYRARLVDHWGPACLTGLPFFAVRTKIS